MDTPDALLWFDIFRLAGRESYPKPELIDALTRAARSATVDPRFEKDGVSLLEALLDGWRSTYEHETVHAAAMALLERGADAAHGMAGMLEASRAAAAGGSTEELPDFDRWSPGPHGTPLAAALCARHWRVAAEIVRRLDMTAEAWAALRTADGLPWLHAVCATSDPAPEKIEPVVRALLAAGCPPGTLDRTRATALFCARTPGVVRMLVAAGVDAGARDCNGLDAASAWEARKEPQRNAMRAQLPRGSADTQRMLIEQVRAGRVGGLRTGEQGRGRTGPGPTAPTLLEVALAGLLERESGKSLSGAYGQRRGLSLRAAERMVQARLADGAEVLDAGEAALLRMTAVWLGALCPRRPDDAPGVLVNHFRGAADAMPAAAPASMTGRRVLDLPSVKNNDLGVLLGQALASVPPQPGMRAAERLLQMQESPTTRAWTTLGDVLVAAAWADGFEGLCRHAEVLEAVVAPSCADWRRGEAAGWPEVTPRALGEKVPGFDAPRALLAALLAAARIDGCTSVTPPLSPPATLLLAGIGLARHALHTHLPDAEVQVGETGGLAELERSGYTPCLPTPFKASPSPGTLVFASTDLNDLLAASGAGPVAWLAQWSPQEWAQAESALPGLAARLDALARCGGAMGEAWQAARAAALLRTPPRGRDAADTDASSPPATRLRARPRA